MPEVVIAASVVPILEELLFRGFILGVLLRSFSRLNALLITSALFSIIHFLKAPERTSPNESVTWLSGFVSIAHSFWQFGDPLLLAAGFLTLFAIGCILADARLQTRSLWLPIGLHAGWIFANGAFGRAAHRQALVLPWLGKDLLVGIVPLILALASWALMRGWLRYADARATPTPFADSLVSFIPRPAPSAPSRSSQAKISVRSARKRRRASRRPFARNARSPSRRDITGSFTCANCEGRVLHFDAAVSVYRSRGVVRKVIHDFKYGRQLHLRHLVGRWLIAKRWPMRGSPVEHFDLIVPVPLHPARQRERGFNQAELLALVLHRDVGVLVSARCCSALATPRRRRSSIAASGWKICEAPFVYGAAANVQGLRMLLVDDVLTTGSTLSECASVLKKAGALSVHAATAARG